MLKRITLWLTLRKIQAAEKHEEELELQLSYMRNTVLPRLRSQRNDLMYRRGNELRPR